MAAERVSTRKRPHQGGEVASESSWTLPTEYGGHGDPQAAAQGPERESEGSGPAENAAQPAAAATSAAVAGGRGTTRVVRRPDMHLDARLVEKPGPYDGTAAAWRPWKAKLVSYLTGVERRFRESLAQAEACPREIRMIPLEYAELDAFLYAELLNLMASGTLAFELVMSAGDENGYEA